MASESTALKETVTDAVKGDLIALCRRVRSLIEADVDHRLAPNKLWRIHTFLSELSQSSACFPHRLTSWIQALIDTLEDGENSLLCYKTLPRGFRRSFTRTRHKIQLSFHIRDVNKQIHQRLQEIERGNQISRIDENRSVFVPPWVSIQPNPCFGFVGNQILELETKLYNSLKDGSHQEMIVVYGVAGVGKTTLLKKVCNRFRQEGLASFFEIIWLTKPLGDDIHSLQKRVARSINLRVTDEEDEDRLQTLLLDFFANRKFVVIFDDIWTTIELKKLGFHFGSGNEGSKIVICTRNKDTAYRMGPFMDAQDLEIKALDGAKGWELFQLWAFKGMFQNDQIKSIAKEVCKECEGVPLVIQMVATAAPKDGNLLSWKHFLKQIKTEDINSSCQNLYEKLEVSYRNLPNKEIQDCFLYCASMFGEEEVISTDLLLRLWIAEGLLSTNEDIHDPQGLTYLAARYSKTLSYRRLISMHISEEESGFISFENEMKEDGNVVIRDSIHAMAIGISSKQNYACESDIAEFPKDPNKSLQRLSVKNNNISRLPREFEASNLVSLNLAGNKNLKEIPEGFLKSLTSLRILDISGTEISFLPTDIGLLSNLRLLNLQNCNQLSNFPKEFSKLSQLQFLDLTNCSSLKCLPSAFGDPSSLQDLRLENCDELQRLPKSFSTLKSLSVLKLHEGSVFTKTDAQNSDYLTLEDLSHFRKLNFLNLNLRGYQSIPSLAHWPELVHFTLNCGGMETDLPKDMLQMTMIERLRIIDHQGLRICESEWSFQRLEKFLLEDCSNLRVPLSLEKLPSLRVLGLSNCMFLKNLNLGRGTHPVLEKLYLRNLPSLEHLADEECEWSGQKLPNLRLIDIFSCRSLQILPRGMNRLSEFQELRGEEEWWNSLVWKGHSLNAKRSIQNKLRTSSTTLPTVSERQANI